MNVLNSLPFAATFRAYWNQIRGLLFQPSSLLAAAFMIGQFCLAGVISFLFPLMLRYYFLPSSIENVVPLDFEFSPCSDDLHGVCSFPTSAVDLIKLPLFDENVYYHLSVRLQFANVDTNHRLGLFQNQLTMYDDDGKKVKQWRKSSFIREPGYLTKLMWIVFFPFYLTGFFHDYNVLEILFANDFYLYDINSVASLSFSLQDKFAQVDYAYLIVQAKLGLVRHFLYYWPIVSFLVLFLVTFAVISCAIVAYWGHRGITLYMSMESKREMDPEQVRIDFEIIKRKEEQKKEKEKQIKEKEAATILKKSAGDEFIPNNVDEVPECPILHNIPGWNVNKNSSQLFNKESIVRCRK